MKKCLFTFLLLTTCTKTNQSSEIIYPAPVVQVTRDTLPPEIEPAGGSK